MNGYEFVMQVKKINPKVKVILMSAFEIQEEEFHSLNWKLDLVINNVRNGCPNAIFRTGIHVTIDIVDIIH
jgi:two-component SAPR family response regulator